MKTGPFFLKSIIALIACCPVGPATAQSPRLGAPTSPVFTSLLSFDITDGSYPGAMSLVQGTDGNFYGVTGAGGIGTNCTYSDGCGTFFRVTAQGTLTTLYSFCALQNCADGESPTAGVILGTDGNFYGVTGRGGAGYGTVYKMTPSGVLTTLHSFIGTDGAVPEGVLVESNGVFYGTTYGLYGTTITYGTVYKITTAGALTTLYNFCSLSGCADGFYPYAGLIQASDGNFYGTTSQGGDTNPCPKAIRVAGQCSASLRAGR